MNEEKVTEFNFFSDNWLLEPKKAALKNKKQVKTTKSKASSPDDLERFPNQAKFMRLQRKIMELSQEDFGLLFGYKDPDVARQTISEIERGRRGIPVWFGKFLQPEKLKDFIRAFEKDQKHHFIILLRDAGVEVPE